MRKNDDLRNEKSPTTLQGISLKKQPGPAPNCFVQAPIFSKTLLHTQTSNSSLLIGQPFQCDHKLLHGNVVHIERRGPTGSGGADRNVGTTDTGFSTETRGHINCHGRLAVNRHGHDMCACTTGCNVDH